MGIDWSLPPSNPLLQPRPPIPTPMSPSPRRPVDVTEDFTKAKAVGQPVPVTAFYTSIEPWLRAVKEEDIGWLEFVPDEVEAFLVPKLGRHYTETWEDEDIKMYGGVPSALDFSASRRSRPRSGGVVSLKWDVSTISDADLTTDKGLGPLSERVVSALLPDSDQHSAKRMKESEEAATQPTNSGESVAQAARRDQVVVGEVEERLKDSAHFYGLLENDVRNMLLKKLLRLHSCHSA